MRDRLSSKNSFHLSKNAPLGFIVYVCRIKRVLCAGYKKTKNRDPNHVLILGTPVIMVANGDIPSTVHGILKYAYGVILSRCLA
jgi:hypothetical protein